MKLEYRVLDVGFGRGKPVHEILTQMGAEGWRLVAAVQRVGNNSDTIRHFFERTQPSPVE